MSANLDQIRTVYLSALPTLETFFRKVFNITDRVIFSLAKQSTENHKQNKHFEALQQLRIEQHAIIQSFNHYWLAVLDNPNINQTDAILQLWKLLSHFQAQTSQTGNPDLLSSNEIIASFLHGLSQSGLDMHSKILILRAFESQLQELLKQLQNTYTPKLAQLGLSNSVATTAQKPEASPNKNQNIELGKALLELQGHDYEALEKRLNSVNNQDLPPASSQDILQDLNHKGLLKQAVSHEDVQIIDGIKQLFDAILSDQHLPIIARQLLVCLQLPFTRIALQDISFFTHDQNHAKSLLKEAVRLCSQWQVESDKLNDDDLFHKLKRIINTFWEAERLDHIPYQQLLFDLLIYGENRRQSEQEQAELLQETEKNAAESVLLRQQVDAIIQEKLAPIDISPALQQLLDEGWSHVLYLVNFRYGMQSQDWQLASGVLDALAATLKEPSAYVSRTQLLILLPNVLKALREGLSFIQLDNQKINQLLNALEKEHKQLVLSIDDNDIDDEQIKKARALSIDYSLSLGQSEILDRTQQSASIIQETIEPAPAQDPIETVKQVIQEPALTAEPEPAAIVEAKHPELSQKEIENQQLLRTVATGSNIVWQKQRHKVAAFIKHTGKYIITDMRGKKVAEFTQEEILSHLKNKTIETNQSEQVFGQALESVISHIRKDNP